MTKYDETKISSSSAASDISDNFILNLYRKLQVKKVKIVFFVLYQTSVFSSDLVHRRFKTHVDIFSSKNDPLNRDIHCKTISKDEEPYIGFFIISQIFSKLNCI